MLTPLRRLTWLAAPPTWLCRLLAALLILGAAVARFVYLSGDCPLDLSPDEAHYWDWSRHLDLSYYSKGPLVAYLIRAGCELFGPLSLHLTGNLMLAVRLPAVACGSLLLVSLYVLTVQSFGREPLALGVVVLGSTLPILAAGSSLMTIDAPYACCWGWALVLAHRAIFRGSAWAWPVCGLVVGLGVLAKYTMVLFPPSLALFLLTTPTYRQLLWRPGFWVMSILAALCCLPIVIWNMQHGWVGLFHVQALSGRYDPTFYWSGPLVYVGGQLMLLLGFWFVVWTLAMVQHNPLQEENARVRYLWWLSMPMFGLFLAFSFKTGGGELNWPVTAYLSGLVLTAPWLTRQLQAPDWKSRRRMSVSLGLAGVFGLALTVVIHNSQWLHPLFIWLGGPTSTTNPMPVRRFDPTCRLRGWRRSLAAEVDALRAELTQADGQEPVLAGCTWSVPGELGFYCAGHPQAYSLGERLNDRQSQYDLWPGPTRQPQDFLGRTFIVVNLMEPEKQLLAPAFEWVDPNPRRIEHRENGQTVAIWTLTVCRGYRGFDAPRRKRRQH